MKTFIKYFVLLAVCTNALAMDDWDRIDRGMSTPEDYFATYAADSTSDRTARAVDPSQNTHDKAPFGDDSDLLGYDRSERARYELDYPSGIDAACLQWLAKPSSAEFTASTKDEALKTSSTYTAEPLRKVRRKAPSKASANSSIVAAPALLEFASVAVDSATTKAGATAIRAKYKRAINRKKVIIRSLICPFRDCPVKLQDAAAKLSILYKHIRTTHCDKQIAGKWHCDQCEKSFKSPCRITCHIYRGHLTERQFICPHCKKGFLTTISFASHMQSVHEEPRYHCVFCDERYSKTMAWKRHLQSYLLRDKPKLRNVGEGSIFACPCGTGCKNAAELEAHSCTWKNTGVFLCPCKKMFKADGWLEHQTTCPQAQWPSKN